MKSTANATDAKLQGLNLAANSPELRALRSLLAGMCELLSGTFDRIDDFNALLADDLESSGGNLEYLRRIERELKNASALVSSSGRAAIADAQNAESIQVDSLIDEVIGRTRRELPSGCTIAVNGAAGVKIRGNGLAFQELIREVLLRFSRSDSDSRHAWNIECRRVALTGAEAREARLGDRNAEAVAVAVLPDKLPFPEIRRLRSLSSIMANADDLPIPLLIGAKWLGLARMNHGGICCLPDTAAPNLVMLFPIAPAENRNDALATSPADATRRPDGSPRTILLVDDEDMIWDVLIDMLQDMGYNVILAGDGKEAVSIYDANLGRIDLVILDMLMPNMGGSETFFILKELDPKVRVLVSSGYVSNEEIQDVMDAGAAGFLRKPYRMADLARKISQIFENPDFS